MRKPHPPDRTKRKLARIHLRPPPFDAVCSGDIEQLRIHATPAHDPTGSSRQAELLDQTEFSTGMAALHAAVGFNRLDMVKLLVDAGASFFPDKEGRWPSLIAVDCEADEELIDYVVQEERRARQEGRTFDPSELRDYLAEEDKMRASAFDADEAMRRARRERRKNQRPQDRDE
ncbi:MAG TPA: hypothetical protein VJX73_04605 [Terracidiphilus sp.]|nr:hypothetical protein [Terracidiphilus sp.]